MYELIRTPPTPDAPPELSDAQRAVVEHPGGPLLVLAGPGTGKTTTLVESVVSRIRDRGQPPGSILVLTFSRKAAAHLRSRIAARLGRSVVTPLAMTFHSFCYAMVRRFGDVEPYGPPIRLLTAPEQEFRVREILAGTEMTRASWPDTLVTAFPTRAFAAEVRSVLARARQLGMDPEDLAATGVAAGRPEWVSAGEFFDEYLDVLDAEQVIDYAELVHRCRILLADPQILATMRREINSVFVDEYQDTDPSQIRLLAALAGDGRDVVAVGDPDQSIYAFRGAEARGILDFPDLFPTAQGTRARVAALDRTYRGGTNLLEASRSLAARLSVPRSIPPEVFAAFRQPSPYLDRPKGRVRVLECSSAGAEAEQVADLLRQANLRDGLPWSQMAVLVRSGRRMIPGLTRALSAAGVPVEVAGDEIPLATEPAVRPLLLALRVASQNRRVSGEEASTLLTSPLGGLDSMAIRQLGRRLRQAEREELAGGGVPRLSSELIARALQDPAMAEEMAAAGDAVAEEGPDPAAATAALAHLLRQCEQQIRTGGTAEEVLWLLWSSTSWPQRLRAEAGYAGDAGRRANRDLDAVCALFDTAKRSEEVSGQRGVTGFLAEVSSQQIPADTLRENETRGDAVRLLTAHRAKGLEWELVVVAGVQEGSWPDTGRRSSLLEADRLGPHGLSPLVPTAVRIAEERRLFYVACTRARSRLVVTAVAGTEGEGDQPSRFLRELGIPVETLTGRPRRPLSLPALVGELRSVSVDPDQTPALRSHAAQRLARLADAHDEQGRPLAVAARPSRWWGMRAPTEPDLAVVSPTAPVQLSGSQLGALLNCPRQWFLARKGRADVPRTAAASFGSVVHVLAEHGAQPDTDLESLPRQVHAVWDSLDFEANWLSSVERIEAETAVERFIAWQSARGSTELVGTEVRFDCELDVGGDRVRLTGSADRVERAADGRIRIVDFKTSKRAPTAAEVAGQDQLGVYQLAVQQGAFRDLVGGDARPAGAELVYLRLRDGDTGLPKVFTQPSLDDVPFPPEFADLAPAPGQGVQQPTPDVTWVHHRLAQAVSIVRAEEFYARVNPGCRYCPFARSCPAQSNGRQLVS